MTKKKEVTKRIIETKSKGKAKEPAMEAKPKKFNKAEALKDINKLMNDINKKFGDNAVIKATEMRANTVHRIPTGSAELDVRLGGGVPEGRLTLISGQYSSTKTTQSLHILKKAQDLGYTCALFDYEGTTDTAYLKTLGIDTDVLLYVRPSGYEECTQMCLDMQKSGIVQLAIIDSIAVMQPTKVLDSKMDETVQMGSAQKLAGEFLGKYQAINNGLEREGKIPMTLIGINQVREKIGAYGDPEYLPGGRAWGFYASVDLRLRKGDWLIEGKGDDRRTVGQVVKFKIEKNKTYKRMQTGEFDFYFDTNNNAGVNEAHNDNFKSIIILALDYGLIEQGGAWYTVLDENDEAQRFQGFQKVIEFLREKPFLVDRMKERMIEIDGATE